MMQVEEVWIETSSLAYVCYIVKCLPAHPLRHTGTAVSSTGWQVVIGTAHHHWKPTFKCPCSFWTRALDHADLCSFFLLFRFLQCYPTWCCFLFSTVIGSLVYFFQFWDLNPGLSTCYHAHYLWAALLAPGYITKLHFCHYIIGDGSRMGEPP